MKKYIFKSKEYKSIEEKGNQTCLTNDSNGIPNTWTVKEYGQSSFIRLNCLGMAAIQVSPMANKKMRKITTLGSHENLTLNTNTVVNSCHP
jgi:hypothetical protein